MPARNKKGEERLFLKSGSLGTPVFLDSIGETTLDIFEQLGNTGTDLDGTVNALRDKFKESQNRLYNIHNFAASSKERMKRGILSSQSLKRKASIATSQRVGWIPRY